MVLTFFLLLTMKLKLSILAENIFVFRGNYFYLLVWVIMDVYYLIVSGNRLKKKVRLNPTAKS